MARRRSSRGGPQRGGGQNVLQVMVPSPFHLHGNTNLTTLIIRDSRSRPRSGPCLGNLRGKPKQMVSRTGPHFRTTAAARRWAGGWSGPAGTPAATGTPAGPQSPSRRSLREPVEANIPPAHRTSRFSRFQRIESLVKILFCGDARHTVPHLCLSPFCLNEPLPFILEQIFINGS